MSDFKKPTGITIMKKISQLFLQGLFAILPITLTLFILYWLGSIAESTLGKIIRWLLPESLYWPGMGILIGFALIFIIGVLLNAYLFRRLADLFDQLFTRIPLVKIIYNSVRDIAKFASISKEGSDDLQKVVLVTLPKNIKLVGFITTQSLPFKQSGDNIAVYLPMSYQMGGFTVIVSESDVEAIDMSVQDAMQFILTAGITEQNSNKIK